MSWKVMTENKIKIFNKVPMNCKIKGLTKIIHHLQNIILKKLMIQKIIWFIDRRLINNHNSNHLNLKIRISNKKAYNSKRKEWILLEITLIQIVINSFIICIKIIKIILILIKIVLITC